MKTTLQWQQQVALARPSFAPGQAWLLQRKCACNQQRIAGGGWEEYRTESSEEKPLPTKRKSDSFLNEAPPLVHEVLSTPGEPLESALRSSMEFPFAYDFSQVRVHRDDRAARSAEAINAIAYTVGQDIVFGSEAYSPGTRDGLRLLAHELAHVVQQQGGRKHEKGLNRAVAESAAKKSRPTQSDVSKKLLDLAAGMERTLAQASERIVSIHQEELGEGPEATATGQAGTRAMVTGLKADIERLKTVAIGDDEALKKRVLAAFAPSALSHVDEQVVAEPKQTTLTRPIGTEIAPREKGIATMPIRMGDDLDQAEIEARRISIEVVAGENAFVTTAVNPDKVNRQVAEALTAAGTALLAGEAEAAPAEAATGPPGWVVGAVVTLAALGLLAAGYIATRARPCPPCPQPPSPQIDRVPPSAQHFPCPGDHWHYFVYNQNPQTCQCFLDRRFGGCCGLPGAPC